MPPPRGQLLDMKYLAEEASRELHEETGLFRPGHALYPWALCQADHGNLGVCFASDEIGQRRIDAMDQYLKETDGCELTDIKLVRSPADLPLLGDRVDYLGDYAQHFFMSG
jgi:hypothetical protein